MRNLSNTRTPIAAALLAGAVVAAFSAIPPAFAQPPQIPATFFGRVSIEGAPVPPGTQIRAFVDGTDCTQPGGSGTFDDAGVSRYLVDVMHETQSPGCGRTGAMVAFKIGDQPAGQSAPWNSGPVVLDLFIGPPPRIEPPAPGAETANGDWIPRLLLEIIVGVLAVGAAGAVILFRKARENSGPSGSPRNPEPPLS
ncbi:MAG: hypothetical protein R3B97_01180 [Dehalococcoidia bacterium]|nr:hypothetical protein [Dehalococcoidia bacterium]MCB9486185.1 hypothetical protein [Thermoflexaceae bacterium]